ncbi:MAG: hypothetical protein J6A15_09115 [Clostridia bacterium]|nr:hypothetical protein [Clostridia bacterium]
MYKNGIRLTHKEQEGCKIKYDDVKKVFNFIDVTDKYILIKDRDKIKKVYIYQIEPVTFLNFSIDVQSNILNLYSEFLRELNFEFQIYISNKKINIQQYIQNIEKSISKKDSKKYASIVNNYIASIAEQLEDETIYTTKYYLVISLERNEQIEISSIDNIVKKLDNIGCNTKRLSSKRKLELLLYESINKEVAI